MSTLKRPDGLDVPTIPTGDVALAALDWAGTDACTLPTAQRPLRLAEFDDLFTTCLRSVDRLAETSSRLVLHPGADTDRSGSAQDLAVKVKELADAETACCSFFAFGVTALDDPSATPTVNLDIAVPAAYVGVLDALLDRARPSDDLDQGEGS